MTEITKPYLLMTGDMDNPRHAKTAFGLRDWQRDDCVGQLRFSSTAVDLGLEDMTPQEAVQAGARTLVIGITPRGGQLPASWHRILVEALEAGLDIASGLHQRLDQINEIADCAARLGRKLHDVRHTRVPISPGTGLKRSGRRLLTVGTDCSLGKKYTALALARAMSERGMDARFVATGQTGILLSGKGIAVDAVVADFISGAGELLTPDGDPDHWDIVEGQGSLFHPSYAGVSLGLLHGAQPDAMVLCHDPSRSAINGLPHVPIVSLEEAIPLYLAMARLTNPRARFVGISLNTSAMDPGAADELIAHTSEAHGLPCADPIRSGVAPIIDLIETAYAD